MAGCVGDGGTASTGDSNGALTATLTEASPSPTATPDATPTPASTGQGAYPDYRWERLDGVEPRFSTTVRLRSSEFVPLHASVPVDAPVVFENADAFAHTVTIPALEVDERLDGGESTELTFASLGTYDYVCTFHPPGMLGRLTVVDEAPTATASPTPTPTEEADGGLY